MAKNKKTEETKLPERKETIMEMIASFASVLVTGLFIVTFNLQAFEIPSESMVATLLVGDHLLVDRTTAAPPAKWTGPLVPYREIERNDIVVFISPVQPGLHVVKRVIGIPGDRIHLEKGVLFRNGQRVDEPWVAPKMVYEPYRDDFPTQPSYDHLNFAPEWQVSLPSHIKNNELIVPPGAYFAMGDNREQSLDSRYWGFIPRENIIGRPMFIYWSFDTPKDHYDPASGFTRIKNLVYTGLNFFNRTRWKRTLRVVR